MQIIERRRRRPMTAAKPNMRDTVDWSIQTPYPEHTVTCGCGHTDRSHAKLVRIDGQGEGFSSFVLIARLPCGVCGGERLKAARSDPETMSITR